MKLIQGVIVFASVLAVALAHGDGAPEASCPNLSPQHGNFKPQTSPIPYKLSFEPQTERNGNYLKVKLAGVTPEDVFLGFMVKAETNQSTDNLGTFEIVEGFEGVSKLMTCDRPGDAITQKRVPEGINTVSFIWRPPQNFSGEVRFRYTVVHSFFREDRSRYSVFRVGPIFWQNTVSTFINKHPI